MNPERTIPFYAELKQLFSKYGIGSHIVLVICHDDSTGKVDFPCWFEIGGDRERNLSRARIGSIMAEHIMKGLLRVIMGNCGLSLHQAVGALQESCKAAAAELQEEQMQFLAQQQSAARKCDA